MIERMDMKGIPFVNGPAMGRAFHIEKLPHAVLVGRAGALEQRGSRPDQGGVLLGQRALGDAPRELGLRVLAALLRAVSGAPYRPRFEALERLFDRLVTGTLGGGATLSGCRIGPAPAKERIFGPATLKITAERLRKGSV